MRTDSNSPKNKNAVFWKVVRDFARTKQLVRLTNKQADAFFSADFEVEGIYVDLGPMVAVHQVWIGTTVRADVSTINRWIHKGMPVLDDAFVPYREALDWIHEWRERTGYNDRKRHGLAHKLGTAEAIP